MINPHEYIDDPQHPTNLPCPNCQQPLGNVWTRTREAEADWQEIVYMADCPTCQQAVVAIYKMVLDHVGIIRE